LRSVDQSEVEFHFKDSNSAGELRPHGGTPDSVYRYVVMPMRI
jgi:DNA polymerase III subunit beta